MKKLLFIIFLSLSVKASAFTFFDYSSGTFINTQTSTFTTGSFGSLFVGGNLQFGTGGGITGTIDGSVASSGQVGEIISSSTVVVINFPTSGNWGDLVSTSIPAGDWLVSEFINMDNASVNISYWLHGIGLTSGNNGPNYSIWGTPQAAAHSGGSLSPVHFTFTVPTTVYLKYFANYTVTTPQATGQILAQRIR